MTTIIRASISELEEIIPLFDLYRKFYKQDSDLEGVRQFLSNRIDNDDCIIYLARSDGEAVGFTLLYKTFSSVSMQAYFILNDLFVRTEYRKQGIAGLLLDQAKELCIEQGYKGLALETAIDNPAQYLYEKLGWKKDTHCFHYFWTAG